MQQFQLKNVKIAMKHHGEKRKFTDFTWVILDSPVRSTLFTLDRQNYNQVTKNSCAEAVPSTPPSEVVWSE